MFNSGHLETSRQEPAVPEAALHDPPPATGEVTPGLWGHSQTAQREEKHLAEGKPESAFTLETRKTF